MSARAKVNSDSGSVTVSVPLAIRNHGGRKQVVTPEGTLGSPPPGANWRHLGKARARAFRWRRLLEDGAYATIAELAAAEKINVSYVSRVLRLTLLAPAIVEGILDGRQPQDLSSSHLLRRFPVQWDEQKRGIRSE